MKVIIQTSIAGHADPRYGLPDFSFRPGEKADIHKDLAAAWIASGVAVKPTGAQLPNSREFQREEIADVFSVPDTTVPGTAEQE